MGLTSKIIGCRLKYVASPTPKAAPERSLREARHKDARRARFSMGEVLPLQGGGRGWRQQLRPGPVVVALSTVGA